MTYPWGLMSSLQYESDFFFLSFYPDEFYILWEKDMSSGFGKAWGLKFFTEMRLCGNVCGCSESEGLKHAAAMPLRPIGKGRKRLFLPC